MLTNEEIDIDNYTEQSYDVNEDECERPADEGLRDECERDEETEHDKCDIKIKQNNIENKHAVPTKDLCVHSNTETNECTIICKDCGMEINTKLSEDQEWRYYGSSDTRYNKDPSRIHIKKIERKNIFKDLDKYSFPDYVKQKTNDLYIKLVGNDILRGHSRVGLIFCCVSDVYKSMNNRKTTDELNDVFDLPKKIISEGTKIFKIRKKLLGKKSPDELKIFSNNKSPAHVLPSAFIPRIMDVFNANELHKTAVIKFIINHPY